jgi:hypothetical protein
MSPTASQTHDGAARRTRLLYTAIGAAATTVAAVLAGLRLSEVVRVDLDPAMQPVAAYGLAGLSLVLIGVAYTVLRPRVPTRTLGQSADEFWGEPLAAANSLVFWAVLEAAAMAATFGFFITGLTTTAPVVLIALAVYWLSGPATFDRG